MNLDRNFLAYLRNQCYGLRKLNYVLAFDMSVFGKLTAGFSGAVGALGLVTSPVIAQDSSKATPASYGDTAEVVAVSASTANLIENEVSRRDAYRASTEQIVYHVGSGVDGVEGDVVGLRNLGYRVTAYFGGEPGQVECFVDRMPCGEYDQATVFDGTMSGTAAVLYNQRIGEPQARGTDFAALNR